MSDAGWTSGPRWLTEEILTAAQEASPQALDPKLYSELLSGSWHALLESDEAADERVLQDFLERHPSLLPGPFSVDGDSGHGPWPLAVITQPPLPGLSTKYPDFMWIATDSESTYPILIEIETPQKRWWHKVGTEVHSDLSHAQGQLAEWRAWFDDPMNQIAFLDYYDIPPLLRRRTIEPRYVLIHGRRSETGDDRMRMAKRGQLSRKDERIMTFDRLSVNPKAVELGCVRLTARGYELAQLPPTFTVVDWRDDRYAAISGWDAGIAASQIPEARASYLLKEVSDLIKNVSTRSFGPRRANVR